jgi:predicted lipoprotein with Yx(FWY)xxD motif
MQIAAAWSAPGCDAAQANCSFDGERTAPFPRIPSLTQRRAVVGGEVMKALQAKVGIRFAVAVVAVAAAIAPVGLSGVSAQTSAPSTTVAKSGAVSLKISATNLGQVITDGDGNVLYMFTRDTYKQVNCEGACLTAWPPVLLKPGQTQADVVTEAPLRRSLLGYAVWADGTRQVTYNGWPLYYWFRDAKPGDTLGQWVNNIWFVLSADGVPQSTRPPAPAR